MKDYHKYIYDFENQVIKGDFEGAYKNCDDVWPGQRNMLSPRYCYTRGLAYEKFRLKGQSLNILDIGCGYGFLVNSIDQMNIGKIVGYDISESAIKKGKSLLPEHISIFQGSLADIPMEKDKYDMIFLFGVLWYLLDDIEANIKKIYEMLVDQGDLLLSIHIGKNSIGSDLINSPADVSKLFENYFHVVDVFNWYQDSAIANKQFDMDKSDFFFLLRKK